MSASHDSHNHGASRTRWYAVASFAALLIAVVYFALGKEQPTTPAVVDSNAPDTTTNGSSKTTTPAASEPAGGDAGTAVATTPTTDTPTDTNTSATETQQYADGQYTATGSYRSPAGPETIDISLTLVDGVIADASATPQATNPASVNFQQQFTDGFAVMVIGKSIDEVSLSKVSGSSLTPKGFNDAVAQIKVEAAL